MEVEIVIRGGLRVTFSVEYYDGEVDSAVAVAIGGVYKRCDWIVLTPAEHDQLAVAIADAEAEAEAVASAAEDAAADAYMDSLFT